MNIAGIETLQILKNTIKILFGLESENIKLSPDNQNIVKINKSSIVVYIQQWIKLHPNDEGVIPLTGIIFDVITQSWHHINFSKEKFYLADSHPEMEMYANEVRRGENIDIFQYDKDKIEEVKHRYKLG